MQINGDKFLRNLEIERERAELERQKEELMSQKTQSYIKASNRYKEDEPEVELNYQELDDIRLNKDSSNKQKYILLGFILVLLFLITIVTIKLISEPQNGNNFGQNDVVDDKKLENGIQNVNPMAQDTNETKGLDIDKIIQSEDNMNLNPEAKPAVATETKPAEGDIFGIAKNSEAVAVPQSQPATTQQTPASSQATVVQPVVTTPKQEIQKTTTPAKVTIKEATVIKETPKQKVPQEVKKDTIKKTTVAPKVEVKKEVTPSTLPAKTTQTSKGPFYIQVGAFSTVPDKNLIVQLQKNNFKYTFQKLERDGKQYSKLLVGGYATKDQALEDLIKIRNEINPNAFIPKGE